MKLRFISCLVLVVAAGCEEAVVGDHADSGVALTVCEQIATTACNTACDCDPAVECITQYGTIATAQYDNLQHCLTFEAYTCMTGGTDEVRKQACLNAVQTPQCRMVQHDGTAYQAYPIPSECTGVL